jgi:anti-sigma28 factor (negative regulator of flagellin synthesis)
VYGGDPNSADWRHFGRLAGFTNRKPEYEVNGMQPYVLLHERSGGSATRGQELLRKIRVELGEQEKAKRVREIENYRVKNPAEIAEQVKKGTYSVDPASEYRRLAQPILEKHKNPDWSKVDWMVARDLARRGRSEEYIGQAIREASPNLAERKAGHIEDYITRTALKAVQEHSRTRDWGYEIGRQE